MATIEQPWRDYVAFLSRKAAEAGQSGSQGTEAGFLALYCAILYPPTNDPKGQSHNESDHCSC
jgi:hypothetical protein